MIEDLLKVFGGRLQRFIYPIPTFYSVSHPRFVDLEKNDHLLLMDLWFYAHIKGLDFFELLIDPLVDATINLEIENINQDDQRRFLVSRCANLKDSFDKIYAILQTKVRHLREKEAKIKYTTGSNRIRLEAEVVLLKKEIAVKDLKVRLLKTNVNLAKDTIDEINESTNKNLVCNYYLLKKLLKLSDTNEICYLSYERRNPENDSIIGFSARHMKQYFTDQIRKQKQQSVSKQYREYFSTLTFAMNGVETTIAINLSTCQVLIEAHGIIQLPNISKTIDFIAAYLLKLAESQNSEQFVLMMDTLYTDVNEQVQIEIAIDYNNREQFIEIKL